MRNPGIAELASDPRLLLAFGFGSGLSAITPGTLGTLAAVPIYLLLAKTPLWLYASLTLLSAVIGVHLCSYASQRLGVHDHKGIVWDEFAGFWLAMLAVPPSWQNIVTGFVLFRFFDMLKPWPISWVDKRIHGGFGIMFDDILA
nr:phosphatidylglycerophosphatase A [Cellvibrionaceae bacterium]